MISYKKTCFIFQHGWGFTDQVWSDWRALTAGESCQFLNRGYWGKAASPVFHADCINTVICHSLGLHFCMPWLAEIDRLVIIGGFNHFHGPDLAAGRFTRKHIKRMQACFNNDLDGFLGNFYRDCQSPVAPLSSVALNRQLLEDDLHLLDTGFADISGLRDIPEMLLLHGANDRIVAPDRAMELKSKLPGSNVMIFDHAGHGLPFTHTIDCWRIIMDFCKS